MKPQPEEIERNTRVDMRNKSPKPVNEQPRQPKPTKRDTQTFRTPNGPCRDKDQR